MHLGGPRAWELCADPGGDCHNDKQVMQPRTDAHPLGSVIPCSGLLVIVRIPHPADVIFRHQLESLLAMLDLLVKSPSAEVSLELHHRQVLMLKTFLERHSDVANLQILAKAALTGGNSAKDADAAVDNLRSMNPKAAAGASGMSRHDINSIDIKSE